MFEDDGESHGWKEGHALWLNWEIVSDAERIDLTVTQRGDYSPAWKALKIVVPKGEERQIWINGERSESYSL